MSQSKTNWDHLMVVLVGLFPFAWFCAAYSLWIRAWIKLGHIPKVAWNDPKGFPEHYSLVLKPLELWWTRLEMLDSWGVPFSNPFGLLGQVSVSSAVLFPMISTGIVAALYHVDVNVRKEPRRRLYWVELVVLTVITCMMIIDPFSVVAWILD